MKSISSLFLVALLVGFHAVNSQSTTEYMTLEKRFSYTDVDGSPYITEAWAEGSVSFKNSTKLNKALLKMNAYENILEIRWQGTDYISDIQNIVEFSYKDPAIDKTFLFKPVKIKNKDYALQIISEGKVTFGILNIVKRVRGSGNTLESINNKDKLKLFKTPYMIKNKEVIEFSFNKKSVQEALSDQGEKVDAYMKDKKLNPKNEDDLKLILDYYNSLN